MYELLAAFDPKAPLRLRFSPDAQELFHEYHKKLTERMEGSDLPPAMKAHLAKFESAMPKLSGLFALADNAIETIDLDHARMACAYCDYLEAHARRAYSPSIDVVKSGAIRLAARLEKGWKQEEKLFTVRDVYQNGWSDLRTPEQVRAALIFLEDAGWVREALPPDSKNGRPSEIYMVNPKLEAADGQR